MQVLLQFCDMRELWDEPSLFLSSRTHSGRCVMGRWIEKVKRPLLRRIIRNLVGRRDGFQIAKRSWTLTQGRQLLVNNYNGWKLLSLVSSRHCGNSAGTMWKMKNGKKYLNLWLSTKFSPNELFHLQPWSSLRSPWSQCFTKNQLFHSKSFTLL